MMFTYNEKLGVAIKGLTRRQLLKGGAGLVLVAALMPRQAAADDGPPEPPIKVDPLAFLRIAADNTVTVICKHLESGQGTYTGLSTLVAEELGCSWEQIRAEPAPSNQMLYPNYLMGGGMGTGGQTGIQSSWSLYRVGAAAAKQMIIATAADRWKIDSAVIMVSGGVVSSADGKFSATLGDLADAAATMPVPAAVTLKTPENYEFIGKHFPRVDSRVKVEGTAQYPQDLHLSDMLTAVVARPTRIGSVVASFDAAAALAMPGVVEVVPLQSGVAVVAKNFWSAKRGRDALKVVWDDTAASHHSSAQIFADLSKSLDTVGTPGAAWGDAEKALSTAAQKFNLEFSVPYMAHATMEPMNVIVQLGEDGLDLWGGPQMQMIDQPTLCHVLNLPPEKVRLHMMFVGGSFGRRAQPHDQPNIEAVSIALAMKTKGVPLKVVWTREDDLASAHSYFRPGFVHRIEAGTDAEGHIVGWRHKSAGQSILASTAMAAMIRGGIDIMSVEAGIDQPYDIPNFALDLRSPELPPLASWLRTTGTFHNGFAVESMIDEIARTNKADPIEMRRSMLSKSPRAVAVLNLAVEKSGWGEPLAASPLGHKRGRGIAVLPSHRSFAAAVVEVSIDETNTIIVDRVVCAIDCGTAVNPDNVRSQIEGAIAFGVGATLLSEITFVDGEVEQRNFHEFQVLRMLQMPVVEAHIVPSVDMPNGASETPMAPIAPAIANAVAAATGVRLTTLPLRLAAA